MDGNKTDQTWAILALDVDDEQNTKPVRLIRKVASAIIGAVTGVMTVLVMIRALWVHFHSDNSIYGDAASIIFVYYGLASIFLIIIGPVSGALGGILGGYIGGVIRYLGAAIGGVVATIIASRLLSVGLRILL